MKTETCFNCYPSNTAWLRIWKILKKNSDKHKKKSFGALCWFNSKYTERVVDRLPLMTYGLKLNLEAWILRFLKKSFNNLRFNELQLHSATQIFFVKLRYVNINWQIQDSDGSIRLYLKLKACIWILNLSIYILQI